MAKLEFLKHKWLNEELNMMLTKIKFNTNFFMPVNKIDEFSEALSDFYGSDVEMADLNNLFIAKHRDFMISCNYYSVIDNRGIRGTDMYIHFRHDISQAKMHSIIARIEDIAAEALYETRHALKQQKLRAKDEYLTALEEQEKKVKNEEGDS